MQEYGFLWSAFYRGSALIIYLFFSQSLTSIHFLVIPYNSADNFLLPVTVFDWLMLNISKPEYWYGT